eukprot:5131455-Alexandrium_andersonii.AAC.1
MRRPGPHPELAHVPNATGLLRALEQSPHARMLPRGRRRQVLMEEVHTSGQLGLVQLDRKVQADARLLAPALHLGRAHLRVVH